MSNPPSAQRAPKKKKATKEREPRPEWAAPHEEERPAHAASIHAPLTAAKPKSQKSSSPKSTSRLDMPLRLDSEKPWMPAANGASPPDRMLDRTKYDALVQSKLDEALTKVEAMRGDEGDWGHEVEGDEAGGAGLKHGALADEERMPGRVGSDPAAAARSRLQQRKEVLTARRNQGTHSSPPRRVQSQRAARASPQPHEPQTATHAAPTKGHLADEENHDDRTPHRASSPSPKKSARSSRGLSSRALSSRSMASSARSMATTKSSERYLSSKAHELEQQRRAREAIVSARLSARRVAQAAATQREPLQTHSPQSPGWRDRPTLPSEATVDGLWNRLATGDAAPRGGVACQLAADGWKPRAETEECTGDGSDDSPTRLSSARSSARGSARGSLWSARSEDDMVLRANRRLQQLRALESERQKVEDLEKRRRALEKYHTARRSASARGKNLSKSERKAAQQRLYSPTQRAPTGAIYA